VQKSAADLQEVAARAALTAGGVKPESVDHVIIGNVLGVSMTNLIRDYNHHIVRRTKTLIFSFIFQATSTDSIYLSRHVSLRLKVPISKPALTVNRLCGSGFQSVVNGAQVMIFFLSF
jgi:acetyl-CoA acyltransferase 2